jgi:hypothetical protein
LERRLAAEHKSLKSTDVREEGREDPHHFEFDLDRGIRAQAIEKLEASPLLSFMKDVGPIASGIYALYYKGSLVYLGKASKGTTKSQRTLRQRLNEHVDKIKSRNNIKLDEMQCRYLTFDSEWWVFAAELALITHYEPEWNTIGFSSKVPGAGRPGTHRVSKWDQLFPKKPPES